MNPPTIPFPKRIETVHVEHLGNELCIYDWQRLKVHTLNPTAAFVWRMCDGQTSPADMASELLRHHEELTIEQAEALVWAALRRLERAGLVERGTAITRGRRVLTRRELLVTLGITVAMLPTVKSIVAPTPAQAQSPVTEPTAAPPTATATATATATPTAQATATPQATATATPTPRNIVLYTAGFQSAELGTRALADNLCATSPNRPAGYSAYRAFISFNADDEIRDMPANYNVPTNRPIQGPTGTIIANNWADLLDGSLAASLADAGVLPAGAAWWSGSLSDGSVTTGNTCNGWTSSQNSVFGTYGCADATDGAWIECEVRDCQNEATHLLCIAFDPA